MITTQYKCDLCGGDIHGNELNLKYKAQKLRFKAKRNISIYHSIEDINDKLPISTEWRDIDVCEDCLKEIIKRKHEKDKEQNI